MNLALGNSHSDVNFLSTKITPFVIAAVLLFLLLQVVQSAGLSQSQIGSEEDQFGNSDVPSGFGDENLYTLEVNIILKEEIAKFSCSPESYKSTKYKFSLDFKDSNKAVRQSGLEY